MAGSIGMSFVYYLISNPDCLAISYTQYYKTPLVDKKHRVKSSREILGRGGDWTINMIVQADCGLLQPLLIIEINLNDPD